MDSNASKLDAKGGKCGKSRKEMQRQEKASEGGQMPLPRLLADFTGKDMGLKMNSKQPSQSLIWQSFSSVSLRLRVADSGNALAALACNFFAPLQRCSQAFTPPTLRRNALDDCFALDWLSVSGLIR
jgi:hypothetical protein